MTTLPTGQQFLISHGRFTAVITEVGATLRSFKCDGAEILWTFGEDEAPRGSMGRQLLPWPNRIRDGRYSFDGVDYQLPITEVPRYTALHGLDQSKQWSLVAHTDDSVTLASTIYPQHGWDAVLDVQITHSVDSAGLTVKVETTNVGSKRAPYGYGAHPYVAADLSTATLTLPFEHELEVDAERLLPVAVGALSPEHDFREPRLVSDAVFDSAFVDPIGDWEITLATPERSVTFWADDTQPWAQVFTTPTRDAMAIEPMTCGPDAFNEGPTHDSMSILDPGAQATSVWGIRVN